MQSNWITYQKKKIFYVRYNGLSADQFRKEADEVTAELLLQPPGSVLAIVETTGLIISPGILNKLKDIAVQTSKVYHKTAVLGVIGARKAMLDMVVKVSGMKVSTFEYEQKALDWLVQE
jgi:hypothetical protein